jgi:CRP-like cAMP-binding protein
MTNLEASVIGTFGFSNEEFQSIQSFFKPLSIKKGEYFLEEGKYCRYLGFVESGILREHMYINEKEVTKWFSSTGYFATDLIGFLHGEKSRVNYQAINDVELMVLSKDNYDLLGKHVERWATLEKLFLTKCFSVLENRIVSHLSMNAEERYKAFFEFQPSLFYQVPLHQIASMLAMSPETLSRMRAK